MSYSPHHSRYESMSYQRCGRSGLQLPRISLGLWHNFGDVDDAATARSILHFAFDQGINHFDLANNYGPPPGAAEQHFGRILAEDFRHYRDELILSTKAGYRMWPGPYGEWGSRKYLLASLDQSLRRMGLDYVDIFYSHRPDPETPLEETMGALDQAVRQGKALYVGISNYDAQQTAQACEILRQLGTPCLIHQPKYSMLERWTEPELLDTLQQCGVGCIAFSPLAQGVLTDRYLEGVPQDSRAAKDHGFLQRDQLDADLLDCVRQLAEVAARRGQSMAQLALAWLLKDDRVTSALVGVSSVAQLQANLGCLAHLDFDKEELSQIEQILG